MSAPSTTIGPVHLHLELSGRPADMACCGRMPRSYQLTPEHPRPATSDTANAGQGQPADNLKESQLAAGRGAFASASDVADEADPTASLKAIAATQNGTTA